VAELEKKTFPNCSIGFQQLDSSDSRASDGSGLGLAISKALIEQHGGKIGFDSRVHEGSTFWFELPCETKNVEPRVSTVVPSVEDDKELSSSRKKTVLGVTKYVYKGRDLKRISSEQSKT